MAITKREMLSCLYGKFGFEDTDGTNHDTVTLYIDGKRVATTIFSRSLRKKSPIPAPLLGRMAVQLRVNTAVLREMIGCTESKEAYIQRLRDGGYTD